MNARFRVLFAADTNDGLIERVEASLARVAANLGADLLRLVQGRDATDAAIPTLDLAELPDPADLPSEVYESLLFELGRAVDDTRWFAQVRGESAGLVAIEDNLVAAARQVDEVLAAYRPHVVLVWNGLLGARAVVVNRARRAGVPVFFCERGPLPGTWCADPVGINAAASIAAPPLHAGLIDALESPLSPEARTGIVEQIAATARVGASAWEQAGLRGPDVWRERLGLSPRQRVLFLPMQVDADTNMRFFSPHFAGSLSALESIARAVEGLPGWFLLVKPHPKGEYPVGAVEQILGSRGQRVADINLHDALALSTLVVTINSTVGAEAVWSGRPVLQLGRGILSGKGIVGEFDAGRPMRDQLLDAVAAWHSEPRRGERALQFYRYLREQYLLSAGDDDDTLRLLQRLIAEKHHTGGPTARPARDIADAHTWPPAERLLDKLEHHQPPPDEVVLVGYGRNARQLMAAVTRRRLGANIRWSAWDEAPQARDRARRDGLALRATLDSSDIYKTLWVVTPRDAGPLVGRLESRGLREGRDYRTLFSVRRSAAAEPAPAMVECG